MTKIFKERVLEVLVKLLPEAQISGIVIDGARVGFALESADEALRKACEKAVFAIPGVEKVTAVLTGPAGRITVENKNSEVLNRQESLKGVKKIIAIAAGKGGVGKSTISVNLAVAMAALGKKVGLADADIYGPSIARMLKLKGKPDVQDNLLIPQKSNGVLCTTMGVLLDDNMPAIWRGPMATKALHQLLKQVNWAVDGELDCLFIDLPPGTGDIHLSVTQHYKIDGAIIVTTPQEVALMDVRKAVQMFKRTNVPILGVIENMSYFEDNAGNKNYIFGQDGGKKLAEEIGSKLLAQIPLNQEIRERADAGTPQVIAEFTEIVSRL